MSDVYTEAHRALQDRFDTRRLADALEARVLRHALTEMDQKFIRSADMLFLTTIDPHGFPTVSYKGGAPGFVRVENETTLSFPIFDGNGMFYSLGNLENAPKVGLLFIDMVTPRRLRVHGTATLDLTEATLSLWPEAKAAVRVETTLIFTNCARYIHKFERVETSEYVPRPDRKTPDPEWKQVDYLQAALPEGERQRLESEGKTIPEAEYRKNFWRGL